MLHFSEFVSPGHPDKIADFISEYLLDRFIEQDPHSRYAVEVQIKDQYVTLGGEVTSKAAIGDEEIDRFVREAVAKIGYTDEYQQRWGSENTIGSGSLVITSHIGLQSPEIAQGVDKNEGWGDQGIFFGYAEPDKDTDGMPYDYSLARNLNKLLFECAKEYPADFGLDIKTQYVTDGKEIRQIVAAIPMLNGTVEKLKRVANIFCPADCELIINGTGSYRSHSSIADCGTTGRKLAVDFYGGHGNIGGGSPWTKDGSKADLSLNLLARQIAKTRAFETGERIETAISCCIGRKDILVTSHVAGDENRVIEERKIALSPSELIARYRLDKPIYANMAQWGLFGNSERGDEWEKPIDWLH